MDMGYIFGKIVHNLKDMGKEFEKLEKSILTSIRHQGDGNYLND